MIRNLLLIAIFSLSSTAYGQAEQNIKVVGKEHYRGDNTIRLKQLANRKLQALGQNPADFQLVGVSMRAKSAQGHGQATLVVGVDQNTKTVPRMGSEDLLFLITAPWSYENLYWDLGNSPGQDNERWQMRLRGNIKTRGVTLHLSSRGQRIRIPMNDALLTGDSTIAIRRELRALGYNVRDKQLKRVVVVAKSRRGRAQIELQVGQNFTPRKTIGMAQNGLGFDSIRPRSYNRIPFRVQGNTQGRWQLHMLGRVKVKAVIVELR